MSMSGCVVKAKVVTMIVDGVERKTPNEHDRDCSLYTMMIVSCLAVINSSVAEQSLIN